MKTIRASRTAALLLAIFMLIALFPSASLAEDETGEAASVAESVSVDSPDEPDDEWAEVQSIEETEWPQEEIEDEEIPESLSSLPEEELIRSQSVTNDVQAMGAEESDPDGSDETPVAFKVTLDDYECEYDGTEHWIENTPVCEPADEITTVTYGFSFETDGEDVENLESLTQTSAGEYTIYVKAATSNGEEAETTAKLIIKKREVAVKADDSTMEYTGSEQQGSATYEFENLVEGHIATIDYTPATGMEVGFYDNGSFDEDSFIVIVKPIEEEDPSDGENTGEGDKETENDQDDGEADNDEETPVIDVTSNYTLKNMTPGILEIAARPEKIEVSISSTDGTWTYDGDEHGNPVYTVKCGGEDVTPAEESGLVFTLPQTGDTLTILEPAMVKNVSDTEENNNTFVYELTNSDRYHVQVNYGTLTINYADQATVTITGNSDTKPYSGSEQSVNGFEYSVKVGETTILNPEFDVALAENLEAKAAGTNAGTYPMGLTKDSFTVTNPNFRNIIVEYIDGYLTIQQMYVTVTVTGHNDTAVYDSKEHSVSGYDLECSNDLYAQNLEMNLSFSGNAYAVRTKAGTRYMGLK